MAIDSKKRDQTIVRTSSVGIIANVLLVIFKATIGLVAGSISITIDALNNFTDVLSSVVTIVGTKISNKKPDKKHPFGHGRVEYIAAFIVATLILFAGGVAIHQSIISIIDYFNDHKMPSYSIVSLIIIGVAVLVKIGIAILYKIQGKKVESETLKASGTDAMFDAILSTGTLVGAIFAHTLGWYVEGYLGIIIGLFIIKSGIEIIREAISSIIGERPNAEETKQIIADIHAVPGVLGVYDLILNNYGHHKNIGSVHIGVDGKLTAYEIQTIERLVATIMYQKYNTIMTVGIYADIEYTEISKKIYDSLNQMIKNYPYILQMHGFYVDEEHKVCNFDLVVSFDDKEPEVCIKKINETLKKEYPEYTFIINQDRDYSLS